MRTTCLFVDPECHPGVSLYHSSSLTDCNLICDDASCIPLVIMGHTGKRLKHLNLGNNVIKAAVLSLSHVQ